MKIEKIELYQIQIPLVHPFRTSFGTQVNRQTILTRITADGIAGWGECVASMGPWYSSDTNKEAWHVLTDFLIPMTVGQTVEHPSDMHTLMKPVRGHVMAKAALENAVWDLFGQAEGKSLKDMLGGVRDRVKVGVSIGIQPTVEQFEERVAMFVEEGYGRIKMKIEPGWLIEPIERIRSKFPEILLMGDANSAFTLEDVDLLKQVDPYNLLMLEQPLSYDDIADHARLQAQIKTAVCLDESIHSPADVQCMIDLKAGRIINMKVGRVGGFTNAIKIHDMAQAAGIEMWCGGMLETGIGRAGNLHLASMRNFTLPGDISATDRYYDRDVADRFSLNTEDSTITLPTDPGLGIQVDEDFIYAIAEQTWELKAEDNKLFAIGDE
ncbi:MAG: o-succinylbenzoate synthase [Chloroflexota bacterium]